MKILPHRVAFIIPLIDSYNPNAAAMGISDYGFMMLQSLSPYCSKISVLAHTTSGKINVSTQNMGNKTVKIIRCWKPTSFKSPMFFVSMLNGVLNFLKVISKENPQIVHTEYDSSHAYGGSMGEPIILALVAVKLLLRKRISVTTHCTWANEDIRNYVAESTGSKVLSKLYSVYYRLMLTVLFTAADSIIALTMHPKSKSTEIIRGYTSANKVFEIVHEVPTQNDTNVNEKSISQHFTALAFGSVRPGKDLELAITSFAEFLKTSNLKTAKLIIAGSPGASFKGNFASTYILTLKHLCETCGVTENVIFDVRHMTDEDITSLFRRADVLLLLYKRRVGPSGVFARAVSCRLPTIINVDGKFASLDSPLPAVLVGGSKLAAKSVADALLKISSDPFFCQKITVDMRNYGHEFSIDNAAARYNQVFTQSLKR